MRGSTFTGRIVGATLAMLVALAAGFAASVCAQQAAGDGCDHAPGESCDHAEGEECNDATPVVAPDETTSKSTQNPGRLTYQQLASTSRRLGLLSPAGTYRLLPDGTNGETEAFAWLNGALGEGLDDQTIVARYRLKFGAAVVPPPDFDVAGWERTLDALRKDPDEARKLRHLARRYRTTCGAPEPLADAENCPTGAAMKEALLAWRALGHNESEIDMLMEKQFTRDQHGRTMTPLMRPSTPTWVFVVAIIAVLGLAVFGSVVLRRPGKDDQEAESSTDDPDEPASGTGPEDAGGDSPAQQGGGGSRPGDPEAANVDKLIERELERMP